MNTHLLSLDESLTVRVFHVEEDGGAMADGRSRLLRVVELEDELLVGSVVGKIEDGALCSEMHRIR